MLEDALSMPIFRLFQTLILARSPMRSRRAQRFQHGALRLSRLFPILVKMERYASGSKRTRVAHFFDQFLLSRAPTAILYSASKSAPLFIVGSICLKAVYISASR